MPELMITLTPEQVRDLEDVLKYIFEHETEDFTEQHLNDVPETVEGWTEIDKQILSKELDPPHVYCPATRVWHALKEQGAV